MSMPGNVAKPSFLVWALFVGGCYADTHRLATFTPPAGWTKQSSATFVTYTRITGNVFCQLAVYDDQPALATLEQSFDREWAGIFGAAFVPSPPPVPARMTAGAGYVYARGESEVADRKGNRFYGRLAAFSLDRQRVQSFVWMASNRVASSSCESEWRAFLETLRFPFPPEQPPAPAAVPSASVSVSGQFENFRYVTPPGWTESRKSNMVSVSPANLQGLEDLAIVLLPSKPVGPLERELDATWNEIISMYRGQPMRNVSGQPYDRTELRRTAAGWDYISADGGFQSGTRIYSLRPYLFVVGGRIERLFVLAADFRAELLTVNSMVSPRFEPEIFRFIFGMRFAGSSAERARVAARIDGPGIVGVWGGAAMSFGSIKPQWAIFLSDGSAYFGSRFPAAGLADIDPAIERERAPREWGVWKMTGTSGQMQMPYGVNPFRLDANALVITTSNTPHRFVRMTVPSLAQLAARWCLEGGECVSLLADGRFRDDGALRVLEHQTYPYPVSLPQGAGRYELTAHTLVFRYDNGPELRIAVPGLPPGPSDAKPAQIWLSFNFDALTRR